MKRLLATPIILISILFFGCKTNTKEVKEDTINVDRIEMNLEQANNLASLPLACVQKEYPNKTGHTLGSEEDLAGPQTLHPAFYGCFDWHSAVHGHWSMVKLLKTYPDLEEADRIKMVLSTNLAKENIMQEVTYFQGKHNKNFERTYGWGWLLKLVEELHTWNTPFAKELEQNLQPLTDLISEKLIDYLPKLQYAVRVGTHSNTAFGLSFAWDYAKTANNEALMNSIRERALYFYEKDTACPIGWEPSGADFLSPCFEELDLMRRILSEEAFLSWMANFLPELRQADFKLEVARVGDREDGQLVHLDGLNFSRAWVFYGLANQYPDVYGHLSQLANTHVAYSFPNLVGDNYEGGHWLGSFAIYALGTS
ncbi:DUF2891 domain-containing protein [Croceitalea rosinachiae]|uniref:DUF2891 domain-containing protein n=1 Tax=Croceitalea rosinachiae TaxID=3075596 RepID=A0ABU3A8I4_9FLAO|nr:DUF2891 domain-containing protein [Croceitalea sp. F388]MDT0606110.1 DUF2891 domain-containing protein [Croceitalea sp. F388]